MTIKYSHIGLLILFFLSCGLYGQDKQNNKLFGTTITENLKNPENGLIRCASTEYENFIQSKYTNRATKQQFEKWISPKTATIKKALKTGKLGDDTIIIPVVVHIIHSGKAVGVSENISEERVLSQIEVLNQDYLKIFNTPGYNTNPVGANMGIQFKLAKIDPKGNITNGIDRVKLDNYIWNTDNVESILKPTTIWDPTKYFNIWVCEFGGDFGDLLGVLGYAQFPSDSQLEGLEGGAITANTDGVIIDWRAFGSRKAVTDTYYTSYDKGRTLTHETGHFLGLRHIWGDNDYCIVDTTDSYNDYCLDTPASSQANYSCTTVVDSCPDAPGYDMTENYMDYSNDTCFNTFTLDQKARVLTVLENSPRRASLTTSEVWKTPGEDSTDGTTSEVTLYPNPTTDVLNVKFSNSVRLATSYKIYSNIGDLILKNTVNSKSEFQINTSNLSSNVYILEIKTTNGTIKHKFIVRR